MYLNCFSRFSIQSIQTTSTSRNVRISLIEVRYSVVNTFKVAQFSKSTCALKKYYDNCRTKFHYLVITAIFNSWWNNASRVVIISLTVYSDLGLGLSAEYFYEFLFGEICLSHHGHAAIV